MSRSLAPRFFTADSLLRSGEVDGRFDLRASDISTAVDLSLTMPGLETPDSLSVFVNEGDVPLDLLIADADGFRTHSLFDDASVGNTESPDPQKNLPALSLSPNPVAGGTTPGGDAAELFNNRELFRNNVADAVLHSENEQLPVSMIDIAEMPFSSFGRISTVIDSTIEFVVSNGKARKDVVIGVSGFGPNFQTILIALQKGVTVVATEKSRFTIRLRQIVKKELGAEALSRLRVADVGDEVPVKFDALFWEFPTPKHWGLNPSALAENVADNGVFVVATDSLDQILDPIKRDSHFLTACESTSNPSNYLIPSSHLWEVSGESGWGIFVKREDGMFDHPLNSGENISPEDLDVDSLLRLARDVRSDFFGTILFFDGQLNGGKRISDVLSNFRYFLDSKASLTRQKMMEILFWAEKIFGFDVAAGIGHIFSGSFANLVLLYGIAVENGAESFVTALRRRAETGLYVAGINRTLSYVYTEEFAKAGIALSFDVPDGSVAFPLPDFASLEEAARRTLLAAAEAEPESISVVADSNGMTFTLQGAKSEKISLDAAIQVVKKAPWRIRRIFRDDGIIIVNIYSEKTGVTPAETPVYLITPWDSRRVLISPTGSALSELQKYGTFNYILVQKIGFPEPVLKIGTTAHGNLFNRGDEAIISLGALRVREDSVDIDGQSGGPGTGYGTTFSSFYASHSVPTAGQSGLRVAGKIIKRLLPSRRIRAFIEMGDQTYGEEF